MRADAGVSAGVMLDVSADAMYADAVIYHAMLLVQECDVDAKEMQIKLQCNA